MNMLTRVCVWVCVYMSAVITVLTVMGILNLNQATAAIKRCCHGNDREGEGGEGGGGGGGRK